MYRPTPPYSDWMANAVEGKVGAVEPSKVELAVLEAVSKQLLEKKQREHRALQEDTEVDITLEEAVEEEEEEEDAAAIDEGDINSLAPPVASADIATADNTKNSGGPADQHDASLMANAKPLVGAQQPSPDATSKKATVGAKRKGADETGSKRAKK